MTEQEWLTCIDPVRMLSYLAASPRKRRLLMCAVCRQAWSALHDEGCRQAVLVAEKFADGQASADQLCDSKQAAWRLARTLSDKRAAAAAEAAAWTAAETTASGVMIKGCYAAATAVFSPFQLRGPLTDSRSRAEAAKFCQLARHIFGNPFKPDPEGASWPSAVVKLAEASYAGEDCAFALRDALLEAGHPELAEHFADKDHPKGCWAVDLLLAKS